jgi:succinoglycan biosynthesis protein ExoA
MVRTPCTRTAQHGVIRTGAWRPPVSLVIAMLDERESISGCLESIRTQSYPAELMEVIVVDGGSRDGSQDLVAAAATTDPRIRMLDNPRRIQAAGFNLGARAARGEVVGLVSAHTTLAPDYVEQCVRVLGESGAQNVGGRREIATTTPFSEAFAAADASRLGIGGARHHYLEVECDVETAFPGCFLREVFEQHGGFDEGLPVHEDYELNWRIRRAGGRVRFSPTVRTVYRPRGTVRALARQQFRYGRGKFTVARSRPGVVRPHHLVPPLLVGSLAICTVGSTVSPAARRSLAGLGALYGTALAIGTVIAGRGMRWAGRRWLPIVMATMHLSWGAGAIVGVVVPLRRRERPTGGTAGEPSPARHEL